MSRDTGISKTSRRAFLRDMAAMGGAAAVAASAGASAELPVSAPAPTVAKPKGYRLTPHVAKYYDKARI
jgi:nitrous oxide reductase